MLWGLTMVAIRATSVVLQTVVGAFVSYLAWMWLLVHYAATKVAVFVFLTPVFALVTGVLWLHEPVSAGIMLVNYRPPRRSPVRSRV